MADIEVVLEDDKVRLAIANAENIDTVLQQAVDKIAGNANMLSASFRTGRFYDRTANELRGDSQPLYAGDVADHGKGPVGIVYTANYAAMKDTHENNTLLKSATI